MEPENNPQPLDNGLLIGGFVVGLLVGSVTALFSGLGKTRQQIVEKSETLRDKLESVIPADPVAESLAEGKAAAHRRRVELGLEK